MEDAVATEPERDVIRCDLVAVGNEVARPRLIDGGASLLLLVGVSRDEPADTPVRHMYEPGAVDPSLRQPAPEVRRPEAGPRLLDRVSAAEGPARTQPG
jgi:hypothetical protein